MEFKGTKGNWVVLAGHKSYGVSIGNRSTMVFSNDCEEDKANALLISKSPELLDMLKKFTDKDLFDYEQGEPSESYFQYMNEAIKLIKQATEL